MKKKIRCKLTVEKIGPSHYDPDVSQIVASPVTSGSEENDQFFKFTPGGSLQLDVVNPDTLAHLSEGDEIYLDLTKAE